MKGVIIAIFFLDDFPRFLEVKGEKEIDVGRLLSYLRRHPTSIAFSRVGYFGLNQKTKKPQKTKNQRFPNLVASAGRAWERLGRPGGAWEGLGRLGEPGEGWAGEPGKAWGGWGSLGRPGKALRSLGSFPPSECPFRPGSFSSLSASFLRNVFKKSLSSLRVSFSTWAVFLPERIIFEKRTSKTNFHPSESPFRPGFLASLSASFLRSVF